MTDQHPITPPFSNSIIVNTADTKEVIRIDGKGFHYNAQFIADAGEAHRLLLAYLKQHTIVKNNNDN